MTNLEIIKDSIEEHFLCSEPHIRGVFCLWDDGQIWVKRRNPIMNDSGHKDVWLIKTDSNGNEE